MNIQRSIAPVFLSAFVIFAAAGPLETSSTTITINSYECGPYSAFLVGNKYEHSGDDPSDTALFVADKTNVRPPPAQPGYTLFQAAPALAEAQNVDFVWQCSGTSAALGCAMGAQMIVNGSSTPNSLTLEIADKTIKCTEAKQEHVRTAINGYK